jgi:hypothetical protein
MRYPTAMDEPTAARLVKAIALREGNIRELCAQYELTREELESFADDHANEILRVRDEASTEDDQESDEPTPADLDDLWISKKVERLARYQTIANHLYEDLAFNRGGLSDGEFSTCLRELRFYMTAAANELGQLLHRGSGDTGSDELNVNMSGINIDNLR